MSDETKRVVLENAGTERSRVITVPPGHFFTLVWNGKDGNPYEGTADFSHMSNKGQVSLGRAEEGGLGGYARFAYEVVGDPQKWDVNEPHQVRFTLLGVVIEDIRDTQAEVF